MKTPNWVVKTATAAPDYTLHLTFADGKQGIYDARPLLEKPLFAKLKSLPFFLNAKAEDGTVVWDDDIDIAPEHLYDCSIPC
ncbi:DUF2442 domain-containing protein [uncultured Selenomonas sp.]|uniref:DUF2442 domain-containing protein n=1 Tax=uncultured Selenomonas sp. TaxID=159275 RepID=UPI0025CDE8B7|nr:DUF2442 domain-containing protein [uncultured Selenomonas sp.]